MALSINEAMDIIDGYGPDEDLWPRSKANAVKDMIAKDKYLADFVKDAKRIDDMLANWGEQFDDDGVDIGDDWDDLDDEDDTQSAGQGAGQGDDEDDDGPVTRNRKGTEDDEDDGSQVIEINPDRLTDMDEMFSNAIQKAFTNADPTEFRVFTRDYDRMVEINGVTDQTSIEPIDQAVAKSTGPIQKDLRRLIAARSQVQRVPGMRKGRLHGPNLHRVLAGDDRVFTRREEAQSLDTAISLVIDCSGSMMGRPLRLATESAYAIGCVLHRLNIQFECLGFTDESNNPQTSGPSYHKEVQAADDVAKIIRSIPIIMPKFKTFDERWNQPVQRRFGHVFNQNGSSPGFRMASTPEGCGMEFAARRLIARKEARKIMIVMTDGSPGGQVFQPRGEDDYWAYRRQSVEMVKAIEAAGVDLIGVGIMHNGPSEYYTHSTVIENIEEMPAQLMGLLKKFIVGK